MNNKEKVIAEIDNQITKHENSINKIKKRAPYAVVVGILFSFGYPYLPGKNGKPPLIEIWDYAYAVVFSFVLFFAVYLISCFLAIDAKKKKIESLKKKRVSTLYKRY